MCLWDRKPEYYIKYENQCLKGISSVSTFIFFLKPEDTEPLHADYFNLSTQSEFILQVNKVHCVPEVHREPLYLQPEHRTDPTAPPVVNYNHCIIIYPMYILELNKRCDVTDSSKAFFLKKPTWLVFEVQTKSRRKTPRSPG